MITIINFFTEIYNKYIYIPLFKGEITTKRQNIKKKVIPLHKKNIHNTNSNKKTFNENMPSQEKVNASSSLTNDLPSSSSSSKVSSKQPQEKFFMELEPEHAGFILDGENLLFISPNTVDSLLEKNEFETFFSLPAPFPSATKKEIVEILKNLTLFDKNSQQIQGIPLKDLNEYNTGLAPEKIHKLQIHKNMDFFTNQYKKLNLAGYAIYGWKEIQKHVETKKEYYEIYTCIKYALKKWEPSFIQTQSQWVISELSEHFLRNIQKTLSTFSQMDPKTLSKSDQETLIKAYRLCYILFNAKSSGEPYTYYPFYVDVLKAKTDIESKFGIKFTQKDSELLSPLGLKRLQKTTDIYINSKTITASKPSKPSTTLENFREYYYKSCALHGRIIDKNQLFLPKYSDWIYFLEHFPPTT